MAKSRNPMLDEVLAFVNTHSNNKTVFKCTQTIHRRNKESFITELGVYNNITKKQAIYPVELIDKDAFEDIKVVALTTKK